MLINIVRDSKLSFKGLKLNIISFNFKTHQRMFSWAVTLMQVIIFG